MSVTFSDYKDFAYVVRPEDVKECWTILSRLGEVHATAYCADKVRRDFKTLDDLLSFHNSASQAIRSLEFDARAALYDADGRFVSNPASAHIHFRANDGIWVWLSLPDDTHLFSLRDEALRSAEDTRAWYWPASRIDGYWLVWIAVFLLITTLRGLLPTGASSPAPGLSLGESVAITLLLVMTLGATHLTACGVYWLHRRWFPAATFTLGKGQARYDHDQQVRWAVIGIGGSLFVGLLYFVASLYGPVG